MFPKTPLIFVLWIWSVNLIFDIWPWRPPCTTSTPCEYDGLLKFGTQVVLLFLTQGSANFWPIAILWDQVGVDTYGVLGCSHQFKTCTTVRFTCTTSSLYSVLRGYLCSIAHRCSVITRRRLCPHGVPSAATRRKARVRCIICRCQMVDGVQLTLT